MRRQIIGTSAVALTACLVVFPAAFGQEKPEPDHYSAVWAGVGGAAGGSTVPIDVRINRYNTDQEIKRYAEILMESGPDNLRRALEKEDVGQFSPVGRVGTPFAIARKLVQGDKTIIRVVTIRHLSFAELRNAGRSVDYPYTMLEMVLDKDGKGTGTTIGAARIRFNRKKSIYEIESFQHGTAYNKLLNVRLLT